MDESTYSWSLLSLKCEDKEKIPDDELRTNLIFYFIQINFMRAFYNSLIFIMI